LPRTPGLVKVAHALAPAGLGAQRRRARPLAKNRGVVPRFGWSVGPWLARPRALGSRQTPPIEGSPPHWGMTEGPEADCRSDLQVCWGSKSMALRPAAPRAVEAKAHSVDRVLLVPLVATAPMGGAMIEEVVRRIDQSDM
jgi:hypothetical protein